jgi:peptidoglycan hydrolase-like protein with peptidoglycan-binding domain
MLKTPQDRLRLARGVGDGLPNEARDLSALASALQHFGRYLPDKERPAGSRSGFDQRLDAALRAFQRSFGLKADGRVLPQGPTQKTLNVLLAGGLGALVPDGTAMRTKRDFEARLKLRGSVGERADNRREDREMVRLGLGASGDLEPGAALDEALDDARLAEGIGRMNRRFGFSGDRQLAPGSRGEALLASVLKRTYGDRLPEDTLAGVRVSSGDRESAGPRRAQLAQEKGEGTGSDSWSGRPSQTGRYIATDDPALGIWEGGKDFASWADYIQRAERSTGTKIPEWKKTEAHGREPELIFNWHPWHLAVNAKGADDIEHFTLMEIFAAEGGRKAAGSTMAGITDETYRLLKNDKTTGPMIEDLPAVPPTQLNAEQLLRVYDAYFAQQNVAFGKVGGLAGLSHIGDKEIAAAVSDSIFRHGASGALAAMLQRTIISTLEEFPDLQSEVDGMVVDRSIGPITIEALRLLAGNQAAKAAFLNALADARLTYLGEQEGQVLRGDRARIDYFRYQ